MRLWTCQGKDVHVDDPNHVVDYTKGTYWKENIGRYREALPELHKLLKTTQFLWCSTEKQNRASEDVEEDVMQWELKVPLTQIVSGYRVSVWDGPKSKKGIFEGKDNWDDLLVPVDKIERSDRSDLGVLVRVPLPNRDWAKCHGLQPVKYSGSG